jgi:hypothetical protein
MRLGLRSLLIVLAIGPLLVAAVYWAVGFSVGDFSRHRRWEPSAAEKMRDAAVKQARHDSRRVLLWFSAAQSPFCELMDRYHADRQVADVLDRHCAILKIDIHQTPGGAELYYETGQDRGVPAFAILDQEGVIVADSGSLDQASNIGFPTTEDELDRYELAMKAGCPGLTEDELTLLRAKLQQVHQTYLKEQGEAEPMPDDPKLDRS